MIPQVFLLRKRLRLSRTSGLAIEVDSIVIVMGTSTNDGVLGTSTNDGVLLFDIERDMIPKSKTKRS